MTIKERVYASCILERVERNADDAEPFGISSKLISRTELANSLMQNCSSSID